MSLLVEPKPLLLALALALTFEVLEVVPPQPSLVWGATHVQALESCPEAEGQPQT